MNMDYYIILDECLKWLENKKNESPKSSLGVFLSSIYPDDLSSVERTAISDKLKADGFISESDELTFAGIRFYISGGYSAQLKRDKQKEYLIKIGQWAAGITGVYYLLEILSKQLPFILSHFCCCDF